MKKVLAFFIFFVSASQFALASGWKQAGNNIYINTNSIIPYYNERHETTENEYSFWTRHFNDGSAYFKNYEAELKSKISIIHTRHIINCYDKKITTKTVLIYDDKSKIISRINKTTDILQWEEIKTYSQVDNYYRNICLKQKTYNF